MSHTKSILAGLALLFAASLAQAQAGSVSIESGKIRFYETKQIRGEETYQINQSPNGDLIVQAKTELPFAGQETSRSSTQPYALQKISRRRVSRLKAQPCWTWKKLLRSPFKVKRQLFKTVVRTPLEAIQAATIVPACVMKLEGEVGAIEVGKRADLIVLDANPLDNISNIRKLRFVVTQGRLFDCARLWQSVDFKN
jgi:hypothetical protein